MHYGASWPKYRPRFYQHTTPRQLRDLATKVGDAIESRRRDREAAKNPVKGRLPKTIIHHA